MPDLSGEGLDFADFFGKHAPPVLRGCDLSGRSFRGGRLTNRTFVFCDLSRADFRDCDLTGSLFSCSDLAGADFRGASLSLADFQDFRLAGLYLDGAALPWCANDLIAHVLLSSCWDLDAERASAIRDLAGSILVRRSWDWKDFDEFVGEPARGAAIDILATYADGDPFTPPRLRRAIKARRAELATKSTA